MHRPGIDFDRWASNYDKTRGVSPSVLAPLLEALGAPEARELLDIGGGTGNFASAFAAQGFRVVLSDISPRMTGRAQGKGVAAVCCADAQCLPFADAAFDCAVSINVVRHVQDRKLAFREARRVLCAGPLVVKVSTEETLRGDWLLEYFPDLLALQPPYAAEAVIVDELQRAAFRHVEVRRFVYDDALDGSFQALKRFPDLLLDDEAARNTAVFQRLPEQLMESGFEQMRRDRASGRLADVISRYEEDGRVYGDGSIFIARP